MNRRKPILITGSQRSGTTWVGNMIATSPSVAYIHEPFNLTHSAGICGAKFDYWFTYVTEENEAAYYKYIRDTISFRYNTFGEMKAIRSYRDVKRMIRDYRLFYEYRFRVLTPLLKDPIALFSAEWLAKRFDLNVLVMVRHPAAFVSSLKRLNWPHSFSHFLDQPLLMRDHLYPFKEEITEYANMEHDIVEQAILLWKIIHYMILKYQDNHEEWIFLRHEDVSREPLYYFRYMFDKFGLEFSDEVSNAIQEHSNSSNRTEADRWDNIKLDSKANIWNWKKRLSQSEIRQVREGVEEISREFYTKNDW